MDLKRVIFMGTPDFAVPVLKGLIDNYEVILVVTQPDKEVGRKQELKFSPIKELALKNNIEVFQPIKIREDYKKIVELKPDLIITCAYGQIIPKVILDCPAIACLNVHASLLPKLRGGAPIHKALMEGYTLTGITIMYMDEAMDSGDIIIQEEYHIQDTDNVGELHNILSQMGAKLLIKTLPDIINGTAPRIKQDESLVTYAYNIKRAEEHLDFNQPSQSIYNHVRGLNPWPLANFILNDQEYKVLDCFFEKKQVTEVPGTIVELNKTTIGIAAQDGIVYITKLKPFGKKVMSVQEYLNGLGTKTILNSEVK